MKYFLLSAVNTSAPIVTDWFNKVTPKESLNHTLNGLNNWTLLQFKGVPEMLDMDIFTLPTFMVSETIEKVIAMYEPYIKWRRVVLFHKESQAHRIYAIPMLEELECSYKRSEALNKRNYKVSISRDMIKNRVIFRIAGADSALIAARLDLVESILRRPVRGIELEEITMENEVI